MAKRNRDQPLLAGFEADLQHEGPAAARLETPPGTPSAAPQRSPGEFNLHGQRVFVVDAHSLIFQVFHAMPEMTGPLGQPVNAVYGFVRDMFRLVDNFGPDYLFCAFDLPGPTFRHEIFPAYKEGREEMPDDLRPQIGSIRRMLEAMRIPALGVPGYEADDVLATMSAIVERAGGECILVTSDKDCRQLISDHVSLLNMRTGAIFDAEALRRIWGIAPRQVVDFQTLIGDPTDNVPGVPLIGPKVAGELLGQYGSLEGLLQHLDEVKGDKRRQNLRDHRGQLLVSRQLVALVTDLPLEVDWEAGRVGPPDGEALTELCREFGFRGFAERSAAETTIEPEASRWDTEYQLIESAEQLPQLAEQLERADRFGLFAVYLPREPGGTRPELLGLAFCAAAGKASYLPLHGLAGLDPRDVVQPLRPVLEMANVGKVGPNLKQAVLALRELGINLSGVEFDPTLASFLLDAGARVHAIEELSERILKHHPMSLDTLLGTGKQRLSLAQAPVKRMGEFAAERADISLRLRQPMLEALRARDMLDLHDEIELPLIAVLAELEWCGIRVDTGRLEELSGEFGRRLDQLEQEIYQLAGHEFNIGSPKQLSTVLFDELQLPVIKKTKTGISTDSEVLEELAMVHPLPAQIIAFRQFAKLKNTYVDALPMMVHPHTGRIHTSYNQTGAATGRLSSNDPNLQNIPVRTQEGREIRSAFVPRDDGWLLVTADYSQIELRVLAHYAQDPALLAAFANDEDIHTRVAAEVFQTPPAEVTPEMRRRAKAVNFGVIYGQSAFGLAKGLRIEKAEAAEFIDRYFETYAAISQFMDNVLDQCLRDGFVCTLCGRRRAIDGVRPANKRGRQKNLAERTAINTVIQGTAADIIKKAMIDLHRRLAAELPAAHMLLQIHDELVFEIPDDQLSALSGIAREEMEQAIELSVPLRVDVKAGKNWAACEQLPR